MKTEHMTHKSNLLYRAAWLFAVGLLNVTLINAQPIQQPTQQQVNDRIAQIIDHDLQEGVFTTANGVRATLMRADMSVEELNEIKEFGDRAIVPLSEYLHSPDYRAQHLAVRALGYIGGKNVVKPLSSAAEESSYAAVRSAAIANLAQHPWAEIAPVVQKVAANDSDALVKKEAQAIIDKHKPISNQK